MEAECIYFFSRRLRRVRKRYGLCVRSAVLRNQSYVWKTVRSTLFRLFFKLFIFVFKAKGVKEGAVGHEKSGLFPSCSFLCFCFLNLVLYESANSSFSFYMLFFGFL